MDGQCSHSGHGRFCRALGEAVGTNAAAQLGSLLVRRDLVSTASAERVERRAQAHTHTHTHTGGAKWAGCRFL